MATRMQQRRGTAAQWTAANPVLSAGEIGFETDTGQFKIGDGTTNWASLTYFKNFDDLDISGYVKDDEKGVANGIATLDGNAAVPLSQLSNVIQAAPETLNTLQEIAGALSDADGIVNQAITTAINEEVANREAAIANETQARNDAIAAETAARNTAINDAIAAEVIARNTAITTEVGNEATSRTQAIADAIAGEVTDRNAAIDAVDTAIRSDLASDISDAQSAAEAFATAADVVVTTNANAYADTAVSTHNTDTTDVHGIADTAALATKTYADDAVTAHNNDTTGVHGIADTSVLATQTDIQGAKDYADDQIDVHVAITTNVHGIADTADLVLKSANTQTLSGDLIISGNLEVAGTTTTVSASDLVVSDPLIYIGEGNTENLVDLGLVSSYDDGTYQHSGIVRDSSANKWKLFKGVTDEPTTTVNFAQGSLDDLAVNNVEVAGVVFSDGTQTKQGVPSITPIYAKTASYTLSDLAERDSLIEIGSQSATTLTIPADSAVNYPVGTTLDILQTSTGQVTVAGASGVTVNATPGLKLRTQWSSATLLKRAANTWVVYGDLSA